MALPSISVIADGSTDRNSGCSTGGAVGAGAETGNFFTSGSVCFSLISPSLSAMKTCWPASDPLSPMAAGVSVILNPASRMSLCHMASLSSGLPARRNSSSSNNHQPLSRPKVRVVNSDGAVASFRISHPFLLRRVLAFSMVFRMFRVA